MVLSQSKDTAKLLSLFPVKPFISSAMLHKISEKYYKFALIKELGYEQRCRISFSRAYDSILH
jgi:hypothetical protein